MAANATTTCPETILATIPWYPDGLSAEECGAVEAHAADCRACRDELAFLRGDEEPAIELPDPERFYARVLERIANDTDERAAQWRAATARRVGAAARQASVAAGIVVAVISGMLTTGAIWVVRVAPTYETASVAPVSAEGGGPSVEVVFRRDANADDIRARLRDVGAAVISGPSQLGVYRLRLAPGADVSAAIGRLRQEGRGVATFAEPSRG